uniref:Protein BFR2 n=1 Tax=Kwoniella pini CBS 10737 TaxID=1296096 RepID=A0A1B9I167_9TREE|nr:protein BFR2 [Kwoniella pini CBS 10737]OCF49277.1 protein BFR2 [Kwoniella pini CBS 10737]
MSSLADQIKKLTASQPKYVDPESAYTSLDSLSLPKKDTNEGKEHYLDVGPSRLRSNLNNHNNNNHNNNTNHESSEGGTLRGVKYDGQKVGRQKIFDDDDEEEEEEDRSGAMAFGNVEDSEEDEEEDEEDDAEVEDDEDEEVDEDDDDDDDDDEDEDDEQEEDEEAHERLRPSAKSLNKALDPMASLRDSRAKDIEKGALFESLLTLRITFQKALTTSQSLPKHEDNYPNDPENEILIKKNEILKSLSELNERLFTIRENLVLPEEGGKKVDLGKRKRDEFDEENYWKESASSSLKLSDSNHNQLLPILQKWSTKIQAASLQLGSKQAGGSKFLQSVKSGNGGVVEAIEAGLASKRESDKTLMESEESGYRSLLREVIESRSGSGPAADLTHLRKEKKKKREAERGGSKGRKLRYTVHEKAQNFVVPIPLSNGWHEEQVDELFSSLFGGVGMTGAIAEIRVEVDIGPVDGEGLSGLGGLRVF